MVGAAAGVSQPALPIGISTQFGADGSVVGYRSTVDSSQEEIDQAAQAGPSLNALLSVAAKASNDISDLDWDPPAWVVYSGGDRWTAVLPGPIGLIAETATVDFNALYGAVVGLR